MAEFYEVCGVDDVVPGRALGVELSDYRLAIYRDGDAFFALSARCPHAAGPMDRGWLEDGEAVCPLHRWRFRLRDGRCTTVRGNELRTFRCEVRDGRVWVAI